MQPLTPLSAMNPPSLNRLPLSDLPARQDLRLNLPLSREACSAFSTTRRNSTETRVPARRDAAKHRAGSVLILVVALLVLMALLGTAYISTTRIDRQTSAQHTKNVQIDMLVQGVVNQVSQAIQGDLYDASGNYRPPDSDSQDSGYDNYDGFNFGTPFDVSGGAAGKVVGRDPDIAIDAIFAKRMPWSQNAIGASPWPVPAAPAWVGVSFPLDKVSPTATNPGRYWELDSPDTATALDLSLPLLPNYSAGATVTGSFTGKPWFKPVVVQVPPSTGPLYPALQAYYWNSGGAVVPGPQFLAADADGDGIADSPLVKLPVGTIDGVTYYYATRIIDNNSALNINSAFSNMAFDGAGNPMAGPALFPRYYTPASEGLAELLRTTDLQNPTTYSNKGTEIEALARYWSQATATPLPPPPGVQPSGGNAISDGGAPITGYQYLSIEDAFHQLLGVRPENPGLVVAGTFAQPFSTTDSMALAHHFELLNPEASPSPFESIIDQLANSKDSFYRGTPTYGTRSSSYPTSAQGITDWYRENFNFSTETIGAATGPHNFLPRRSMVVASNPVSMQSPIHPLDIYVIDAGMEAYRTGAPASVKADSETKVSINQAPFGDLWRAFWNVMAENVTDPTNVNQSFRGSPFDLRVYYTAKANATIARYSAASPAVDPPTFNDPYLGDTFAEYNEITPTASYWPTNTNSYRPLQDFKDPTTPPPQPTDYHPARMFRSPVRAIPDPTVGGLTPGFDVRTPRLNSQQTMLLRSAIAAVNAEDLRDSDDDVTAHRILLTPTNGAANPNGAFVPAEAIVYGTERQPYITEIYASTDPDATNGTNTTNPYGYVAIELYNPYDHDIVMPNWKLVAVDRRSGLRTDAPPTMPPYRNASLSRATLGPGSTPPASQYNLVLDQTTLIADFDPDPALHPATNPPDVLVPTGSNVVSATSPLVVPAHGYLLLENYYSSSAYTATGSPPSTGFANYRPPSTGLPLTGPLTGAPFFANGGTDRSEPATDPNYRANARTGMGPGGSNLPQINVACVPGLSGMPDTTWSMADNPEWGMTTGIRSVFNRELVLLRPRRADGQYSHGIYPQIQLKNGVLPAMPYDERPNTTLTTPIMAPGEVPYSHLRDLVPVDSFDFTGLQIPEHPSGTDAAPVPLGKAPTDGTVKVAAEWHYARQNVDASGLPDWKFVYPGRYCDQPITGVGTAGLITQSTSLNNAPLPRQQGTQYVGQLVGTDGSPWAGAGKTFPVPYQSPLNWFTFGMNVNTSTVGSSENPRASYRETFKIPLAIGNYITETIGTTTFGRNTIGENPLSATGAQNHYPFGGFAREGDILATPFIGAYTIRYCYTTPTGAGGVSYYPTDPIFAPARQYGSNFTIAEMNAVTMDSTFAEDTDIHDDPDPADENAPYAGTLEREQVGRFCPVRVLINETVPPPTIIHTSLDVPDYNPYPTPNFTNYTSATGGIAVNDFGFDPSYVPANPAAGTPKRGCDWEPFWRYHWASDLFDYLAVRTPSDDYLPNYPMQKEWRVVPGFAQNQQQTYHIGDLVSFYDPGNVGAAANPQLEIYRCTGNYQPMPTDKFPPGSNFIPLFQCPPVKNSSDKAAAFRTDPSLKLAMPIGSPALQAAYLNEHAEDDVPVQGLININTADWKVLSTLPLIVDPATGIPDDASSPYGNTYRQLNEEMAKAIEYYRDVDGNENVAIIQPHGPFRSIFELNRVVDLRPGHPTMPTTLGYPSSANMLPGFQNGYGTLPMPNTLGDPGDAFGDFSPANTLGATNNVDGVRGDYEERNLQLTRISNMITTRSDSFTCYILVQGWRNAETANAQLVVQRRVGYLMDRSRVTPLTPDAMSIEPFPNN